MYKVLIADDEKRICKLIEGLVDWQEKRLEVIDVVHNGREALEVVKQKNPDIIITDIRMPELGGLDLIQKVKEADPDIDFVIISGHREFDYARKALQYGAEDYLLKPIRQNELNRVLDQIISKKETSQRKEDRQKHLEQSALEQAKKLNSAFVRDLIIHKLMSKDCTADYLEQEYQCSFPYEQYSLLAIKMDVENESMSAEEINGILKKRGYSIVVSNLGELKESQYCESVIEEVLYLLVNYDSGQEEALRHAVRHIIYDFKSIGSKGMQVHATIGMSRAVKLLQELPDCVEEIKTALANRIIKGVDRIIDVEKGHRLQAVNEYVDYSFQQRLLGCVESLNKKEILDMVESICKKSENLGEYDGKLLYDIWQEITDLLLVGCKPSLGARETNQIKKQCEQAFRMYYKKEQMERFVKTMIDTIFERLEIINNEKEKKPIQSAKQYMELHYREPLTLENVGDYVELNAAYFSSLFKKETGQSFSEFLTSVRMKKAKELLMIRGRTVLDIANSVGYSDEKYFSRTFKKNVGLTPSEYRRLYC